MKRNGLHAWAAALAGFGISGSAWADYALNLQAPASKVAGDVYHLHNLIMLVCLGIFIVVFGTMFYSLYAHRKSKGYKAAHFHENTTVEVIWTVIPFVILMGMAYPAAKVVIDMKDTSNSDMTIKVTGYQWKWGYDYLQDGVSFFSELATPPEEIHNVMAKDPNYLLEVDHPVVVPINKRVRLLITANDVIHAWWMPAFAVKQDAIPGFIRDVWFKADRLGTFRGQCAELCGKEHGFMPIVLKVVSEDDYKAWVAQQKGVAQVAAADNGKTFTLDEMKQRGEKVFTANCAACHQANGMGIPGTFPALNGSKVATGPIEEHLKTVINGRPGTAMAAFGKQLSDVDLAAVVTYERNAWDNHMGDMAQASQVAALKGGAVAAAAPAAAQ
jgi:cytochrome c oxidase subunit 2